MQHGSGEQPQGLLDGEKGKQTKKNADMADHMTM
jgi:hypothetical protein